MLRCSVIHHSGNIVGRRHLEDNYPIAIYPSEASKEAAEAIGKVLKALVKPIEQFTTVGDSIQYHGLEVAGLIQDIALDFPSISSYCQIGAHTLDERKLDERTGVSKVVKPGDTEISIRLTSWLA